MYLVSLLQAIKFDCFSSIGSVFGSGYWILNPDFLVCGTYKKFELGSTTLALSVRFGLIASTFARIGFIGSVLCGDRMDDGRTNGPKFPAL